jgi:hypothetical protein
MIQYKICIAKFMRACSVCVSRHTCRSRGAATCNVQGVLLPCRLWYCSTEITNLKVLHRCAVQSIKWAHRALWIDLCIYLMFLLSFLLAAWDGHMFISIYTKYASLLEVPDPSNTFEDLHSVADFWSWWKGPMRCVNPNKLCPYASEFTSRACPTKSITPF